MKFLFLSSKNFVRKNLCMFCRFATTTQAKIKERKKKKKSRVIISSRGEKKNRQSFVLICIVKRHKTNDEETESKEALYFSRSFSNSEFVFVPWMTYIFLSMCKNVNVNVRSRIIRVFFISFLRLFFVRLSFQFQKNSNENLQFRINWRKKFGSEKSWPKISSKWVFEIHGKVCGMREKKNAWSDDEQFSFVNQTLWKLSMHEKEWIANALTLIVEEVKVDSSEKQSKIERKTKQKIVSNVQFSCNCCCCCRSAIQFHAVAHTHNFRQ